MEGGYGLLAFCLVIAAQFVAVVFVCELRSEHQKPDDPADGQRRRRRFARPRHRGQSDPVPAHLVLAAAG